MEIAKYIGKGVKRIRVENELSQEEFAEKTGFHYTYISLLETGKRQITVSNLEKIIKPFQISLSEFLENYKSEE